MSSKQFLPGKMPNSARTTPSPSPQSALPRRPTIPAHVERQPVNQQQSDPSNATPLRNDLIGSAESAQNVVVVSSKCAGTVGAVSEQDFLNSFAAVTDENVSSGEDAAKLMEKIKINFAASAEDWEKRVKGLKLIRSLMMHPASLEAFWHDAMPLQLKLQACLKSWRSRLVRETCITIAFLSVRLKSKFDWIFEGLLLDILQLIDSHTRVIASSARIALDIVFRNTQSPRLLPTLMMLEDSKSHEVRGECYRLMALALELWHPATFSKLTGVVSATILQAINDASPEARAHGRAAFIMLNRILPSEGEILLQKLDQNKQRQLKAQIAAVSRKGPGAASEHGGSSILLEVPQLTDKPCQDVSTGETVKPSAKLVQQSAVDETDFNCNTVITESGADVNSTSLRCIAGAPSPAKQDTPTVRAEQRDQSVPSSRSYRASQPTLMSTKDSKSQSILRTTASLYDLETPSLHDTTLSPVRLHDGVPSDQPSRAPMPLDDFDGATSRTAAADIGTMEVSNVPDSFRTIRNQQLGSSSSDSSSTSPYVQASSDAEEEQSVIKRQCLQYAEGSASATVISRVVTSDDFEELAAGFSSLHLFSDTESEIDLKEQEEHPECSYPQDVATDAIQQSLHKSSDPEGCDGVARNTASSVSADTSGERTEKESNMDASKADIFTETK